MDVLDARPNLFDTSPAILRRHGFDMDHMDIQPAVDDRSATKRKEAPVKPRADEADKENRHAQQDPPQSEHAPKRTKLAASEEQDVQAPSSEPPNHVQLKNGKLVLTQKTPSWQKSMATLKAIFELNDFLDTCVVPLEEVPPQHLHVIAKLAQESDKTLLELAKHIQNVITPVKDTEDEEEDGERPKRDLLPLAAYKQAIPTIAERVNYGLDLTCLASSSSVQDGDDALVPTAVQIWRWEVHDITMLDAPEKAQARRRERQSAREQAKRLVASLPHEEQVRLLTIRKRARTSHDKGGNEGTEREEAEQRVKALSASLADAARPVQCSAGSIVEDESGPKELGTPPRMGRNDPDVIDLASDSDLSDPDDDLGDTAPSSAAGSSSRTTSPQKQKSSPKPRDEAKAAEKEQKRRQVEAKRAEREASKAQREADLDKKKKTLAKQQAALGKFLMQTPLKARKAIPDSPAASHAAQVDSKDQLSDFEHYFKPCNFKDIAPINRFHHDCGPAFAGAVGANEMKRDALLADMKAKMPAKRKSGCSLPSRRGVHPRISVRQTMHQITEASVMGLGGEIKMLEEIRKDRRRLPIKLMQFESDRRPPWFGTHSRSTNMFGPRQPLKVDTVALDYSYDSDAEWEDVGAVSGDDMNEVDEKEEDAEDDSDRDSDLDSWLVDDLEEEEVPDDDDEIVEVQPLKMAVQGSPTAGKASNGGTRASSPTKSAPNLLKPKKKRIKPLGRRFDSKLIPFATGPHWEEELGRASYENFKPFQMEFLNGAYPGLNPFEYQAPSWDLAAGSSSNTSAVLEQGPTKDSFKQPTQPARKGPAGTLQQLWAQVTATDDPLAPAMPPPGTASAPTQLRARPAPAKQPIPDEALPDVLRAIEGSTRSKVVLADDLKTRFGHLGRAASKANLEACINQYADKEGGRKAGAQWHIKAEYRALAGLE